MTAFNLFFTSFPITVLAVYDKDITYEYIMNEEEEVNYYQTREFNSLDLDSSYVPTSTLKIMPLIKSNFQYLYHTTQQNWDFGWKIFFVEVINSIALAVVVCTLAFSVCSGTSVQHQSGFTYDFWMTSFTIYGSIIYITNLVVVFRSGQITWFVMFWVAFFSIIPFLVLSLLFDTVMNIENGSQYILLNMGSTYHYYLVCAVMTFIAFLFEAVRKCVQVFWWPRLSDYFRLLINLKKENDPENFDKEILESFAHLHNPIQKHKYRKMKEKKRLSTTHGEAIASLVPPSITVEQAKIIGELPSEENSKDMIEANPDLDQEGPLKNLEKNQRIPEEGSPSLISMKKSSPKSSLSKNEPEEKYHSSSIGLHKQLFDEQDARPILEPPLHKKSSQPAIENLPPLSSRYSNSKKSKDKDLHQ